MNKTLTPRYTSTTATLTRRQRAWVALYTLQANPLDRLEVLRQNNVTEADLEESFVGWRNLQLRFRMRLSGGAVPEI